VGPGVKAGRAAQSPLHIRQRRTRVVRETSKNHANKSGFQLEVSAHVPILFRPKPNMVPEVTPRNAKEDMRWLIPAFAPLGVPSRMMF